MAEVLDEVNQSPARSLWRQEQPWSPEALVGPRLKRLQYRRGTFRISEHRQTVQSVRSPRTDGMDPRLRELPLPSQTICDRMPEGTPN
jgi:hypothetical protein